MEQPCNVGATTTTDTFPIRDVEWGDCAALAPETETYNNTCRKQDKYSPIWMRGVIREGGNLSQFSGGIVEADRQIQLALMGKLGRARSFIDDAHQIYPEIEDESISISTNEVSPTY